MLKLFSEGFVDEAPGEVFIEIVAGSEASYGPLAQGHWLLMYAPAIFQDPFSIFELLMASHRYVLLSEAYEH